MNWYKMKAGWHKDGRVLDLLKFHGRDHAYLWNVLLSMMAEKYDGDPNKPITVSRHELATNSLTKPYLLPDKLSSIALLMGFKAVVEDQVIIVSYPKFMKLQKRYVRDGGGKYAPVGVEGEYRIKNIEEEKRTKKTSVRSEISFDYEKGRWQITDNAKEEIKTIYGDINLNSVLRQAAGWLMANKTKRKKDFKKFLYNWLNRDVDKPKEEYKPKKKKLKWDEI